MEFGNFPWAMWAGTIFYWTDMRKSSWAWRTGDPVGPGRGGRNRELVWLSLQHGWFFIISNRIVFKYIHRLIYTLYNWETYMYCIEEGKTRRTDLYKMNSTSCILLNRSTTWQLANLDWTDSAVLPVCSD